MKLSARNVFKGTITKITRGAVNSEVTIRLDGGTDVVSIITNESVDSLRLKEKAGAHSKHTSLCW